MNMKIKNKLKKLLTGGLIFFMVISTVIFIYGKQIKNELRYFYWDVAKDIHHVESFPGRTVSFYSDSLKIIGDLFEADRTDPPAIVMLHGSSPHGRKAPVIQILARKFRDKGYTVLAIDMRAYGESQDPASYTAKNFDFPKDVISAVDFLIDSTRVDKNRIYIVGHSGGAGAAIGSINEYGRINKAAKMVLLGPPRRHIERILGPDAKERDYFYKRWKKDMDLPYDIVFSESEKIGKIEEIEDLLTIPQHIPLFLIDGSKEKKEDLEYLKNLAANSSPPLDYWTIPGTGHYLDTKLINGELIYTGNAVDMFVDKVDEWLKK
jgi:alpha/beta superfamily hydrolase